MLYDLSIRRNRLAKLTFSAAVIAFSFLLLAPAARAVTYIQGFDVYSGDGAVNWASAKAGGYQFAFVKATEGVNFIDSRFTTNMNGAHNAGVLVGPYHFTRIESKDGVKFTSYDGNPFPVGSDPYLDATSEAADFIQSIRPFYTSGSYLPPVADVETFPSFGTTALNKAFVSNWIQLFSDSVKNAIGVRPMIYTSSRPPTRISLRPSQASTTLGSQLERHRHRVAANSKPTHPVGPSGHSGNGAMVQIPSPRLAKFPALRSASIAMYLPAPPHN